MKPGRKVGPLRQRFETLTCFWCGAVDDVGGKQPPVAQGRGETVPEGWLHVYANMEYFFDPQSKEHEYELTFEDGDDMRLGCFFVCSEKCQATMKAAVKVAETSYVNAIQLSCPRLRRMRESQYVCHGCGEKILRSEDMVGSHVFSIYAHKRCEQKAIGALRDAPDLKARKITKGLEGRGA